MEVVDSEVDTFSGSDEGIAGKRRLVVSLAQKVCVRDRGKQRVLESEGSENDANKNDELGVCYRSHGSVIVSCRK